MDASERALRKHLALATTANTLGITAHMTYMYYLAPLALRHAGVAGRDAVIFSLVAVAMGLAVIPAGRLADRHPRRRVHRAGLLLLAASYAGLLVPGLASVALGTIASGIGLALLFVSFQSYIADLLDGSDRAVAYGRAGALAILASAAGPFLAALLLRAIPDPTLALRANALLFAAAGATGALLTLALPSTRTPPQEPAERGRWHHAARAAAPIAILYLFMGAGYGMTAPYFTVYFLDHVGLAPETWGYLLAAGTIASAAGSTLAGSLARRIASAHVATAGMTGLLLASLVFAYPAPALALALGFLARSFFSTTVAPGMSATMMARARLARRAETQAYGSLAWNIGWATGAAAGGVVLARAGGSAFPLGAAIALAGVTIGAAMLRARA